MIALRVATYIVASVIVVAAGPAVIGSPYWLSILTAAMIDIILLSGLHVAVGQAGLVSVAHGALLAVGAYTTGILETRLGWGFWSTVPLSVALGCLGGLALGLVTLRLAGHYFVIASLAFGIGMTIVIQDWVGLTNGNLGITPINGPGSVLGLTVDNPAGFYRLVSAAACIVIALVWVFSGSKVGVQARSIRENTRLASSVGVNVFAVRLTALAVSSGIAALAGSFQAAYLTFIDPSIGDFLVGFSALLALVIGGRFALGGAVLGSLYFVFVPELLRDFSEWRLVIFGGSLIVVVLLAPDGIWGALVRLRRRVIDLIAMRDRGSLSPSGVNDAPVSQHAK